MSKTASRMIRETAPREGAPARSGFGALRGMRGVRGVGMGILAMWSSGGWAWGEERFPPPEFRTGYTIPTDVFPSPASGMWNFLDTGLLLLALSLAAWLVFYRRSRRGVFLLTCCAVAYFGFVRKGCVCPIGSIQNVSEAAFTGAALPWVVGAFFALPLIFVLLFGRVFCSCVCPLGAIQDLFTWKTVHVPRWLEVSLGLFAYFYLGLAVLYAACGGAYIICQYDPFVPMFRLSGPSYMFLIGGLLLAVGVVVGRPYCRFICPYGVILRLLSPFSRKQVSITPAECIDCRLCEKSCPYNAIRLPTLHAKAQSPRAGKGTLLAIVVLSPVLIALLALLGYRSGDTLSLLHRDVQLAREVAADQASRAETPTDTLKVFRASGQTPDELYAGVDGLRLRFRHGAALLGVWMGLVVSGKLISHTIRRRRGDYSADPGTCVACARCFSSCPVELKRRGVFTTEDVEKARRTAAEAGGGTT